jgi:sterol-4alpha-carboxylate 3-dehydrogenase (decarboxylating)
VVDLRTTRNRLEGGGVSYFDCDITSPEALNGVFAQVKPDVVIHTASPPLLQTSLMKKVNVDGTKAIIEACQRFGVRALVYTSSASIISDNKNDLVNADEQWPIITGKLQTEYYSQTKVRASFPLLSQFPFPLFSHFKWSIHQTD